MCMRFRNSRCYFGSEVILERQNLSLREGYLSVHCHHERRLEPRLRGESKSRDLLCQVHQGLFMLGNSTAVVAPRSRSFDSGRELASEFLPSAQDDKVGFGVNFPFDSRMNGRHE